MTRPTACVRTHDGSVVDYSGDSLEGNCDAPRLNLVTSAIQALKNPPEKFDDVFELSAR